MHIALEVSWISHTGADYSMPLLSPKRSCVSSPQAAADSRRCSPLSARTHNNQSAFPSLSQAPCVSAFMCIHPNIAPHGAAWSSCSTSDHEHVITSYVLLFQVVFYSLTMEISFFQLFHLKLHGSLFIPSDFARPALQVQRKGGGQNI